MDEDEAPVHWIDQMRADHEATLTVGTRVKIDIGECPHYLVWHGWIEQGVAGIIMGLDVAGAGRPADHRYWVWFDWPIEQRRSWSYAAHELSVVPPRTPDEIEQEVLARLNAP